MPQYDIPFTVDDQRDLQRAADLSDMPSVTEYILWRMRIANAEVIGAADDQTGIEKPWGDK